MENMSLIFLKVGLKTIKMVKTWELTKLKFLYKTNSHLKDK